MGGDDLMNIQDIHLKRYDWDVRVYYGVVEDDIMEILEYLDYHSYSHSLISSLQQSLLMPSTLGMTVANMRDKLAVVIIMDQEPKEFFNTLIHELNHVTDYVAEYWDLPTNGELVSYMIGDMSMMLFPVAGKYLCSNHTK